MAEAGGQQVLFGPTGPVPTAILRTIPVAHVTPDWDYVDGADNPLTTKVELQPEMDATTAYNVFVCTGESTDLAASGTVPPRASAEVTDPSSPIYPGTFGRSPTFLTSPFMRTNAQCQAVADATLPIKAGGSETSTIVGFAHPAHEAGDTLLSKDAVLGQDTLQVLSRFTMSLDLQDLVSYACRARRVA
jgi:hypothetical protein